MSQPQPPSGYYQEIITIHVDRLTLLAVTQSCAQALRHPDLPDAVTAILENVLRYFIPEVNEYAPADALQAWQKLLGEG